jgi:hypothetical protein
MRESGEWFSPRSAPETLTSDDPPVPTDKPELVRILPGPATAAGRAAAPLRRLAALVPALGRRLVRVDDEPTRWQLVGMWATGSAIVAGTGLAVATVLGGAPPALTQPFERLSVLPGISDSHSDQTVTSADKASTDGHSAPDRQRAVDSRPGGSSSDGYSGSSGSVDSVGSYPAAPYPEDLVPGRPIVRTTGTAGSSSTGSSSGAVPPATGVPAPPVGGATTTPPATEPPPPVTDPTAEPPATPTVEPLPTDPAPTDPAPTDDPTPPDTTPVDPPVQSPTYQPDSSPADPPVAETPPADPTPTADASTTP